MGEYPGGWKFDEEEAQKGGEVVRRSRQCDGRGQSEGRVRECVGFAAARGALTMIKKNIESLRCTLFSQIGGFVTPAESGTLTNFVEIGQARDKILSLKLDQVGLNEPRKSTPKY